MTMAIRRHKNNETKNMRKGGTYWVATVDTGPRLSPPIRSGSQFKFIREEEKRKDR